MNTKPRPTPLAAAIALLAACAPVSLSAQPAATPPGVPAYADIASLADSASLVVRAQVMKLTRLEDERAPGLAAGQGRFYVTAKTQALVAGSAPIGESLVYLVDLPLDARGKPPPLKKRSVLLFARAVPGRPGELQLVRPGAQLLADAATEATARAVLAELVAPGAPARITGVRELIYVPGNLAGEGETQIFLATADRSAASITVRHQPGAPPAWGASFSELVADVSRPPRPDTLEWYRLACFLPNTLPPGANLSEGAVNRAQADADYRQVLGDLGACRRSI